MSNSSLLRVLNLVGLTTVIAVNILANALPINGVTTGEVSDRYPNLFAPVGLTFAIWGLVYLALIGFAIYQFIAPRSESQEWVEAIGPLFIISSIANVAWIFAWHYDKIGISLLCMLVLLATLLAIYLRLGIGVKSVAKTRCFLVHKPFSIYLGWITVATIANVTTMLVKAGWNGIGLSEAFWAVLVIATAAAITLAVLFTRRDLAYAAVIIWAFAGIIVKRLQTQPVVMSVVVAASVSILMIILGILYARMISVGTLKRSGR